MAAVWLAPQPLVMACSYAIFNSLQTRDADQVSPQTLRCYSGAYTEMGSSKYPYLFNSLFHACDGSIDELFFDAQIAETQPQMADAL